MMTKQVNTNFNYTVSSHCSPYISEECIGHIGMYYACPIIKMFMFFCLLKCSCLGCPKRCQIQRPNECFDGAGEQYSEVINLACSPVFYFA